MPTVPRIQARVQQQGLPGVRISSAADAGTFGGGGATQGVANAVQEIVTQQQKMAAEEKKKADDLATTEAYAKIVGVKNKLFWDPKEGAMTKKGKDAFGVIDQYGGEFDKQSDEILKSLGNEEQRAIVGKMKIQAKTELEGNLQKHVFTESQRFDEETTQSSLAVTRDDAVVNYQNPEKVTQSIKLQEALLMSHAARSGKPPEWVQERVQEASSKTHADVITRMLANGDDLRAAEYYKKNKGAIRGEAAKVEAALETGTMRGASQRYSDQIVKEYSDLEAAREAVKAIKDPKLRDAVDDRVKSEFAIKKQSDHVHRERTFMEAATTLEGSKRLDSIPPEQWNALLPGQRSALRTLEKQLSGAAQVKHDDQVYLKYVGMAPQALSRVSEAELIEKVRPNVKEGYFKEIVHRWTRSKEAANGNTKASAEVKSMFTDEEMVLAGLQSAKVAGIKDGTKADKLSSDQAKIYREFREKVDSAWQAHYHTTGHMPNGEQKRKIVNDLLVKKVFINDGTFYDSERPVATLSEDELKIAYKPIAEIPATDRTLLLNLARAQGVVAPNVSDERAAVILKKRIERAYAAALAGGGRSKLIEIMTRED